MRCFSSCAKVKYIVLDNIPQSPTITVIPASMSKEDIKAANQITELIVSCGIKTIERPVMLKERSDFESAASGGGIGITAGGNLSLLSGGTKQSGELRSSVNPVGLIKEKGADYIFIVNDQDGDSYIKLIKRENQQILYAGLLEVQPRSTCCLYPMLSTKSKQREYMIKLLEEVGVIK